MSLFRRGAPEPPVADDDDLTPIDPDAPDAVPAPHAADAAPANRRALSFRTRIALLAAVAVAVAVVLASAVAYFEVRHELYAQVDNTLKTQRGVDTRDFGEFGGRPFPGDQRYFQGVAPDGTAVRSRASRRSRSARPTVRSPPVDATTRSAARTSAARTFA